MVLSFLTSSIIFFLLMTVIMTMHVILAIKFVGAENISLTTCPGFVDNFVFTCCTHVTNPAVIPQNIAKE
jgi:hypothetical protein